MDTAETERLQALADCRILDTPREEAFDRLAVLAAEIFDAPMASVSLVDAERQWFKAKVGLELSASPRDGSPCAHAIAQDSDAVLVVEDASRDPRFRHTPLVAGPPHVRFYAGAALTTANGHNLGALCVMDDKPRSRPSAAKLESLKALAKVVVDEIELRHAKRQAEEKRPLLEMAEPLAGLGHWRLDAQTRKVWWSPGMYAIYGMDPDQPLELSALLQMTDAQDRGARTRALERMLATGETPGHEITRIRRLDGELRYIRSQMAAEFGPDGSIVGAVGALLDVTEQRQVELALARSEAAYKLLAENASDVVLQCDAACRVLYVSPSSLDVTGYAPEAIIGKEWCSFVRPDDAEQLREHMEKQVRDGVLHAPEPLRYRFIHADGRELWLEGRPTLTVDSRTGASTGFTSMVRDISLREAGEAELRRARAEAEAAAAAKSEFLANMSHELRTPLTAVLGFAQLIREQPDLTDKSRAYLERVSNAGQALLTTVNDILDFSKLEARQVEIRPRPVSPRQLAADTLDLFALQAAEKNLVLATTGLEALPAFTPLDPDRVRQILLNLIGNAVKFTATGSVTLEASYDPVKSHLSFAVVDTGAGIAAEDMDRLFQRFSQVDDSSTRKHDGTGLGLAICKGLVEAMGGQIGVDSQPGRGSRFWFFIPAAAVRAPNAPDEASRHGADIPPGCRVLVADDNAVNRALVSAVLGAYQAQVVEAEDGVRAVQAAMASSFDVILMDLRMPNLDGVGAASRIRREPGPNKATPIIAFSADVTVALPEGLFCGAVAKPISATSLVDAIARAVAPGAEVHAAA